MTGGALVRIAEIRVPEDAAGATTTGLGGVSIALGATESAAGAELTESADVAEVGLAPSEGFDLGFVLAPLCDFGVVRVCRRVEVGFASRGEDAAIAGVSPAQEGRFNTKVCVNRANTPTERQNTNLTRLSSDNALD